MIFLKRFFVLPLALLIFCGCSQTRGVTPVLDNLSFTANVKYDKSSYVCDATVTEGVLNLVVKEPREIKGFTLTVDKNGTQAKFNDAEIALDTSTMPQGAVAQVLFDVVNDANTKETTERMDGNYEIIGNVNNNNYNFVFSPTGLPISLKIENIDFEIEFQNVTVI